MTRLRNHALLLVRFGAVAALVAIAARLSFSHIIETSVANGMTHDDAALMPWSVDGLLLVSTLTIVVFGDHLTKQALFWATLGRYAGMVATIAANILAVPSWDGLTPVGIVIRVIAFGWAPFAMLVAMEVLLHSTSLGAKNSTAARRRASAQKGARTRKANKAAAPSTTSRTARVTPLHAA